MFPCTKKPHVAYRIMDACGNVKWSAYVSLVFRSYLMPRNANDNEGKYTFERHFAMPRHTAYTYADDILCMIYDNGVHRSHLGVKLYPY